MKFQYIIILCVVTFIAASCEFDNYDAPASQFQGRIVYQGDPIHVSYNDVYFELWEAGWGKNSPIDVAVAQDGSFSAMLFDARYRLVIPSSQGPFMSLTNSETESDTIIVDLKGSKTMDIEVMPYYMVRNSEFSASGSTLSASCGLEQIITDVDAKNVERVSLYVSKTQFVDGRTSISTKDMAGGDIADMNNINISAEIPDITPSQGYIYARIGVKIQDVEDMIFSPVEKVDL